MSAPRILWRYIFRDVLLYSALALTALTILVVLQNMIRHLDELVAAGAPLGAIVDLTRIILPSYLAYAIPTALLFGVLLSFGRMAADGEIIAMRAGGVSVQRMLPPVLALGVLATTLTGYIAFEVEPRSRVGLKMMLRRLEQSIRLIRPGAFQTLGNHTIYVHSLGDETCPLEGVLVGDSSSEERTLYIAARCGRPQTVEGEEESLALVLLDGSVHFSDSDTERYRRIRFNQLETRLDLSHYFNPLPRARDFRFGELLDLRRRVLDGEEIELRSGDALRRIDIQIHRRLAFPAASVVLALLAVPLGIRPLRAGRSWGALTAIGVMGTYWVLFTTAEVASKEQLLPVAPAMWAPNLLLLGLAVFLIRRSLRSDS